MNPTLRDLRSKRACTDGYNFYAEHNCDPAALVPAHPGWYLWRVARCPGDWIDLQAVDKCAEKYPGAALYYASELLSPERLDWCAEKEPWYATVHASTLLTPYRRKWCEEQTN